MTLLTEAASLVTALYKHCPPGGGRLGATFCPINIALLTGRRATQVCASPALITAGSECWRQLWWR